MPIKFEDAEGAPGLKYSIAEPNSYPLKNLFPINVPKGFFKDGVYKGTIPEGDSEPEPEDNEVFEGPIKIPDPAEAAKLEVLYENFLKDYDPINQKDSDLKLRYNEQVIRVALAMGFDAKIDGSRPFPGFSRIAQFQSGDSVDSLSEDQLSAVASQARAYMQDQHIQKYYLETTYEISNFRVAGINESSEKSLVAEPYIIAKEEYQLSNYRGNYGAGRVIKTHSLAPGEKNKFTVKTYEKTSGVRNEGSSILDSNTREASSDFEKSFERESSQKLNSLESDLKNSEKVSAEASASILGFGGSVKGSYEKTGQFGTQSSREEFGKTVGSAVQKHSNRASSKRNIEVNFSSEQRTESGNETSLEREVENINVSRTLNLVFRQMAQEYISVLHLLNLKFSVYDGTVGPYPEYSIHEIDEFIDTYFVDEVEVRREIKQKLLKEFYYVYNYEGDPVQFLEKIAREAPPEGYPEELGEVEPIEYWRIKKPLMSTLDELPEGVDVPGIVTHLEKVTILTDGVIMDAFLGLGEGLDNYSKGLQNEAVRERTLENDKQQKALDIIDGLNLNEKTEAYEKMLKDKKRCHVIELNENIQPENPE